MKLAIVCVSLVWMCSWCAANRLAFSTSFQVALSFRHTSCWRGLRNGHCGCLLHHHRNEANSETWATDWSDKADVSAKGGILCCCFLFSLDYTSIRLHIQSGVGGNVKPRVTFWRLCQTKSMHYIRYPVLIEVKLSKVELYWMACLKFCTLPNVQPGISPPRIRKEASQVEIETLGIPRLIEQRSWQWISWLSMHETHSGRY
jgi:hypothetical protein